MGSIEEGVGGGMRVWEGGKGLEGVVVGAGTAVGGEVEGVVEGVVEESVEGVGLGGLEEEREVIYRKYEVYGVIVGNTGPLLFRVNGIEGY